MLAVVVVFLGFLFRNSLRGAVYSIGDVIWTARGSATASLERSLSSVTADKAELLSDNEKLLRENKDLRREVALLRLETSSANVTTGFEPTGEISARVILKPPFSSYDLLVAEDFSAGKVQEGDHVLSARGNYLGSVVDVGDGNIRIRTASSPDFSLPVLSPSAEMIELVGQGGGSFFVRVPKNFPLAKGDILTEPHTNTPVALVRSVEESKEDPFNEIYLSLLQNIFSVEEVLIIPQ